MNNKFLVQDNLNKNNPNFHRNSSLDSTKSSLRVKKIKLHNEFTPFYKITVNQNVKNILDFPICMSLFTNNYSVSEKDKTKSNSNNNIKINYQNLKNNIINKDKQIKNDLFLPKTKKIISRNAKGIFVKSFSPINSLVKSSILKGSITGILDYCKLLNTPVLNTIIAGLTRFSEFGDSKVEDL